MQFNNLFRRKKPIIGMIHLAGRNIDEKVKRALEELIIYETEGIDGAIIEDYHGSIEDVEEVLKQSQGRFKNLVRGVNTLRNPYLGFKLANNYDAKFVQFDSVQTPDLDLALYDKMRKKFPNIVVLGGIGFKYTSPTGNPLEIDLKEGKSRCDAIVTTGEGTGIETPTAKLRQYKELLGNFPLIDGAGVNAKNAREQLMIVDGVIIGSFLKSNGNTQMPVEVGKIREIMGIARYIRKTNTSNPEI